LQSVAVAKAKAGQSNAFPDLGGLKDLADKALKTASDVQSSTAATVKTALLELAHTLNNTLLEVDKKVDSVSESMTHEKEKFIHSVTSVVQQQIGEANASLPGANETLAHKFEEASSVWTTVTKAGEAAARAFTGGLTVAGMDDIASSCNETLAKALQEADAFKASMEQAKAKVLQVSASEAPAQLARINGEMEKALKHAGGFSESFAATFDELYSGIVESFNKNNAGFNSKSATSSLTTALGGSLDEESKLEVKAAFSSLLQTAQSIVGKTLGIASDLASGVKSGLEATGVKIDKSAAQPVSRPWLLAVAVVTVAMGATL